MSYCLILSVADCISIPFIEFMFCSMYIDDEYHEKLYMAIYHHITFVVVYN